jgi:hypothetical protein
MTRPHARKRTAAELHGCSLSRVGAVRPSANAPSPPTRSHASLSCSPSVRPAGASEPAIKAAFPSSPRRLVRSARALARSPHVPLLILLPSSPLCRRGAPPTTCRRAAGRRQARPKVRPRHRTARAPLQCPRRAFCCASAGISAHTPVAAVSHTSPRHRVRTSARQATIPFTILGFSSSCARRCAPRGRTGSMRGAGSRRAFFSPCGGWPGCTPLGPLRCLWPLPQRTWRRPTHPLPWARGWVCSGWPSAASAAMRSDLPAHGCCGRRPSRGP